MTLVTIRAFGVGMFVGKAVGRVPIVIEQDLLPFDFRVAIPALLSIPPSVLVVFFMASPAVARQTFLVGIFLVA